MTSACLAGCLMLLASPAGIHDVRELGAVGDGLTKDTTAVQAAVDAADRNGGGEVAFPAGVYRCGTVRLKSNVTLRLGPGAVILASPSEEDFDGCEKLPYDSHADQETTCFHRALLSGEDLHDVAIEGEGAIDGNRTKRGGPKPIALKRCRGVTIRGITVKNSPNYSISFLGCEQVVVDGVTVLNGYSDGIDPDCCRGVRISNCFVDSWDDAICPKASLALGSKAATEDVVVTNCTLASSCNQFKLGTESSGDFRSIALSNCTFLRRQGSRPGIAGVAINSVDGSNIDGVAIANVVMREVDTPLFIRLGGRGRGQDVPAPGSIRNLSISNLIATGARSPCTISGLPGSRIHGVRLDGLRLSMGGGGASGKGLGRGLEVPEEPAGYPDAKMFGELPAYGLYVRHAEEISIRGLAVELEAPDARPAMAFDDLKGVDLTGFRIQGAPGGVPAIVQRWVMEARFDGSETAPPGAPTGRSTASTESLTPMKGAVLHYRSRIYQDAQPYAVCVTDLSPDPKPLIVDFIPGTYGRPDRAARDCEEVCRIAAEKGRGCVALRPCGRGNGSLFEGFGEVDVYEAIDALRKLVAIDPERVTATGSSMGGAATWYHVSHYPDFWAGAAPFCGYCDYQLWEKPGGTTFHRQGWEEFSWMSRDAAYRVENLRAVPLRITHGEWDRAVGGGVSVEHSRRMDQKLSALEIPHVYVAVPKTGHGCRTPALWQETLLWLLEQKRSPDPEQISLVVHTLRHNRSRWVGVEQQVVSGKPSRVEARVSSTRDRVQVTTENVHRLALGPIAGAAPASIELDGQAFGPANFTSARHFARDAKDSAEGAWTEVTGGVSAGEKRHGLSGPFGDLFFEPVVIIYGASGTEEETEFNRLMARNAVRLFSEQNGGLHRGGIQGDNAVEIPRASDRDALATLGGSAPPDPDDPSRELLERANLFLIGNERSNALLAELLPALPLRFHPALGTIDLCGNTFSGDRIALYAVLPHPDGKRAVALLSGNEPDAITWGSHVGLQLLPDYLVFNRGEILKWGFWNNAWR